MSDRDDRQERQSAPDAYDYRQVYPSYGQQENQFDVSTIWHYIGLVRRRFWLILPFVLIGLALGLIKAAKRPTIYSARSKIMIEKSSPNIMSFDSNSRYGGYDPAFTKTQPEIIKSRVIMEIALENPAIMQLYNVDKKNSPTETKTSLATDIKRTLLAVLGGDPAPVPAPWELLSARINASPEKDTSVIAIHVTSSEPEEAALLANATSEAFKEYHLRLRLNVLQEAAGSLIKERDKQKSLFIEAEKDLQEFYETAEGFSGEGTTAASTKLTSINSQRTSVQLDLIKINAELAVMRQISSTNEAVVATASSRIFAIPSVQSSEMLASIKRSLADTHQELSLMSETYGPQSPAIKTLTDKIHILEAQFRETVDNLILSQEQRGEMLKAEESKLLDQYNEQKIVLLAISEEAFTLQRLKDSMKRHRSLYDLLAARTAQLDVSTSLATTTVQIIEKAAAPTRPLPRQRQRTILLFLMIGITSGFGLAFVLESLDKTIKTPEDLIGAMDAPLLGFVPAMDDIVNDDDNPLGLKEKFRKRIDILRQHVIGMKSHKHSSKQGKHISRNLLNIVHDSLLKLGALTSSEYLPSAMHYRQRHSQKRTEYTPSPILADKQSSITEAYRHIRTNLLYSNIDQTRKVLTFTSCGPKEGKTTTCCNLALSIAMSGKKVLLIDADLHGPKINLFLNIHKTKESLGLTSVLVGETSWRNAIKKVRHKDYIVNNLDVMLSGPSSPHPAELLGSEAMKGMLKEARAEYDWIIIDTPPVLFVSDAIVLSSFSDGTVIIVKAGTITQGLLDRTKSQLDNIQANIIGSILNNMILSSVGRYYSYYGHHGYSSYSKDYHKTYYGDDDE